MASDVEPGKSAGEGAVGPLSPRPTTVSDEEVVGSGRVQIRGATLPDADRIAALHADSWRRNYRGAYPDSFLDGEVFDDRRDVWRMRLTRPDPNHRTVVADFCGDIVGFAHTDLDDDPTWGALLDNLHVADGLKRRGIGTLLLAASARGWSITHQRDGSTCGCWNRTRTPGASTTNGVVGAPNASVGSRCPVTGCAMCGTGPPISSLADDRLP